MHLSNRMAAIALAGALTLGLTSFAGAASNFQGNWKVKDTKGQPFEIALSADGKAAGTREGEGMTGTWKEEGGAAVISWNTGWITKIVKEGNSYKKHAWDKGKPVSGPPSNTSDAEKIS